MDACLLKYKRVALLVAFHFQKNLCDRICEFCFPACVFADMVNRAARLPCQVEREVVDNTFDNAVKMPLGSCRKVEADGTHS